jgi:AraC-like DNA-binding protein
MTPTHTTITSMPAMAAVHSDVARLLADAQSALARDPDAALRHISHASALLVRPEPAGGGLAAWQANKVTAYITANLAEPITIDDLADQVGLSASYFSRAFRATFGEAPYVHVLRRRIEHACGLMLATPDPLSQIAIDCGLADQSHFTRLFRRFLGTTPHAWRRARRQAAA